MQPNPVTIPEPAPRRLADIATMDDYLRQHGRTLAKKAITSLDPLHVPGRDELPDFDGLLRDPFPCQQHVIAAATKMLDESGSGFLVGEMGTGKSLMGQLAIHAHAKGKPYRALVLCPDHLIAVWEEELRETIPGVIIHRFDNWKGFLDFFVKGHTILKEVPGTKAAVASDNPMTGVVQQHRKVWSKPTGPEWYIIGRNQAKWYPDWNGISAPYRGFNGSLADPTSRKYVVVDHEPQTDEQGRPVLDRWGQQKRVPIIDRVHTCPRCGEVARNTKGIAYAAKDLHGKAGNKRTCLGYWADEVPNPDHRKSGKDRRSPELTGKPEDGKVVAMGGKRFTLRMCKEPLWGFTSKPYRWPPARIIQRKLRRMFKYLIIDEVHEQKSDESAQSMAAGKLMASTDHVLALTGTLIGGYANHLFPLMLRMTPKSLRGEGFEWGKDLAWSQTYGRVDRIVTTKMDDGGTSVGGNVKSMRKARTGKSTERQAVRPGIMPTMFGRHMIGSSLFITLEELADELPDLDEFVEDGACDMAPEVKKEYERIEELLAAASKELLMKGSMKLLGTMLFTLMDYPDMPYGWTPEHEGELAVGYYEKPKVFTKANWRGVVTPADLGQGVQPKEQKLLDICKSRKAMGRQCWVYTQMTGKRNVQPRLKKLLEAEGLRVAVLRSDTVDPKERKEWIDRNGPNFDVIISHPKLVSTGLTLFSKRAGGHNFSTIIFYETGYNLFDMRQAARRAWRIGQPQDCEVFYLYYRGTMQHRAMQLMSRKLAAATALEGEFSTEGLVAMAGEDNAQMALARALSEKIDDADMQRSWGKVKSGTKKVKRPVEAIKILVPEVPEESPLDALPEAVQLAAEVILDHEDKALLADLPNPSEFGSTANPDLKVVAEDDEEEDPGLNLPVLSREQLVQMFRDMLTDGLSPDELDE